MGKKVLRCKKCGSYDIEFVTIWRVYRFYPVNIPLMEDGSIFEYSECSDEPGELDKSLIVCCRKCGAKFLDEYAWVPEHPARDEDGWGTFLDEWGEVLEERGAEIVELSNEEAEKVLEELKREWEPYRYKGPKGD